MDKHPKPSRRVKACALRVVVAIGFVVTIFSRAPWAEPAVTTKIYCDGPDVPAQFVAADLARSTVIFERAVRQGACTYHPNPVMVRPLRFVRKAATGYGAVERFAYVWAIRLVDGNRGYWFFWKDAHEAMLRHAPGI